MRRRASLALLAVLSGTANLCADVVELRDAQPRLDGTVRVDDGGATVVLAGGAESRVSWDRVKAVHMDNPPAALARYVALADDLWRARTRLERGDAVMAEPLFERAFERTRGQTNETALVAAEGLLRCRLARGAHDLALIAALETARLRRAQVTTQAYGQLRPVLDLSTALCTALAPMWVASSALLRLERDLNAYDAENDEVVAAIARLYGFAVQWQLGMAPALPDQRWPAHEGVRLLRMIVEALVVDRDARSAARQRLARDISALPEWAQAWGRVALGLSLLAETDPHRRQTGVVQLLHVPAVHAQSQPYLAGLALARAAEALASLGDGPAAGAVRAELRERFPGHPVLANGAAAPGTSQPKDASRTQPKEG